MFGKGKGMGPQKKNRKSKVGSSAHGNGLFDSKDYIVPAQSDIYSEEELSRVEQKYRRRKREREREVKRDEGEKTAPRATLERASMRECAAQWLLIAFKSASR